MAFARTKELYACAVEKTMVVELLQSVKRCYRKVSYWDLRMKVVPWKYTQNPVKFEDVQIDSQMIQSASANAFAIEYLEFAPLFARRSFHVSGLSDAKNVTKLAASMRAR